MAVIRQLKNFFTNKIIYPKTITKAVYDANGERLDNILKDTFIATDEEGYKGVEPRDADVLGGKYTARDIDNIKDDIVPLANKGVVSDAYSNLKTYAVGDYCIRDNKLYKCITAVTSQEEFDSTKWKETTCGDEFSQLNSNSCNNFGIVDPITLGTDYTCPSDGIIKVGGYGRSSVYVVINGNNIAGIYGGDQAYISVHYSWRVRKGDIVRIDNKNDAATEYINVHYFIPYA